MPSLEVAVPSFPTRRVVPSPLVTAPALRGVRDGDRLLVQLFRCRTFASLRKYSVCSDSGGQKRRATPAGLVGCTARVMVVIEDDSVRMDAVCQPLQVRHRPGPSRQFRSVNQATPGCPCLRRGPDPDLTLPLTAVSPSRSTTPGRPSLRLWARAISLRPSPRWATLHASRASGEPKRSRSPEIKSQIHGRTNH